MEDLKLAIQQNKWIVALAACVLVAFVAFSAYELGIGKPTREAEEAARIAAEEEAKTEEETAAQQQEQAAEDATEAQKTAIKSYGTKEKAVNEVLVTHLWVQDSDGASVTFDNGGTVRLVASTSDTRPYAITAVGEAEDYVGDLPSGVTSVATQTVAFLIGDDKTELATLYTETAADGTVSYRLYMPWVTGGSYSFASSSKDVALELPEMPEEAVSLLGGDEAALLQAFEDWANENMPSATAITWSGAVNQVFANDVNTSTFTVAGGAREVDVQVTYDTETGELSVIAGN